MKSRRGVDLGCRLLTSAFWLALSIIAFEPDAHAAERQARWEFTEDWIKKTWLYPIATMDVVPDCAGPVHGEEEDCEIHVGAALGDPSIGDFQNVVLEPPNVCKEDGTKWREELDKQGGKDCTARGFLRVWPEHLAETNKCSNPAHVLELHPLLDLTCPGKSFAFSDFLVAHEDLGYKDPANVRRMLNFQLWVRVVPGAGGNLSVVEFDYCSGTPKKCNLAPVSNFARLQAKIIPSTIRPEQGHSLPGFATVIARVLPMTAAGNPSGSQAKLLKLYAIEGTDFHTNLLARRGTTSTGTPFDILGIWTVDSLSVIKAVETATPGDWESVNYPIALIAFGETQ